MQLRQPLNIATKKLIVFDLDGTLAESKSPMDQEMSTLLTQLLGKKKIAVIGGGKYEIFKMQLLKELRAPKPVLKHLFLFPTTATRFYRYQKGWKKVYALNLSAEEVRKIKNTFNKVFKEIGYTHPKKTYGEIIENRGTQVSFSVYGQDLVAVLGEEGIRIKTQWKRKNTPKKMQIARLMQKYLPEFEVRAAGFTTVDVTRKGIDKAYGIKQIEKHLHIPKRQMLFVGDALFPGGNDFAVRRTGVKWIAVKGTAQTKQLIRSILALSS
ncbi:HAD-IIB family hydrolase [Candidatus Uhrbacteria bacterium]|nr:HAD-IIB family hydrolase [Candidatus Uhrbacteria bacterium]